MCFNPRTHEGCDVGNAGDHSHFFKFQSTHPRGVRRKKYLLVHIHGMFQSTHPRGVRPNAVRAGAGAAGFNPRTYEGCDALYVNLEAVALLVSIHAPTRGATAIL